MRGFAVRGHFHLITADTVDPSSGGVDPGHKLSLLSGHRLTGCPKLAFVKYTAPLGEAPLSYMMYVTPTHTITRVTHEYAAL